MLVIELRSMYRKSYRLESVVLPWSSHLNWERLDERRNFEHCVRNVGTIIFSFWLDQYYSRASIIIFTLDWRYVTIILKSLWNSVWIFIYSIFSYIQICISRVSVIKKLSEIRDREIASRILTIRSTPGLASEYILINIHRSASKFPNLRTDGLLNISCVITRENMNWNYSITALKNSPL